MAKLVHSLFLFLLVFALLACGTNDQWSITLVEGLCFLLFMLHLLNLRREKSSLCAVPGILPLVLLAGFAILQIFPLPPFILKLISPKTWALYKGTVWVVRPDTWMPISVVPKATLAEFFRLAAYVTFYLMTVQLLDSREQLKKTAFFFTTFIGLFSLAGIIVFIFSKGRVFWFLGGGPIKTDSSFFLVANKNHYAGLLAMVLPVVFAQFLANRPHVSYSSFREKFVEIVHGPNSNPHILSGIFLTLLLASLLLTFSWGGVLGSLASLLAFILLLFIRGGSRKKSVMYALYLVAILLTISMVGWGTSWVKSDLTESEQAGLAGVKRAVWKDSANIIGDFPLLGTGFGTFADIYPRYKTTPMETSFIEYARNDYSEFMAEGGLVGAFLVGWFILSFLRKTYPIWRLRHNRNSVYLYLGGLAGLVAILLHSLVGSALHVGVVGLYFFFLAGLATAATTSRSRGGSGNERAIMSPVYLPRVSIAVTAVLFVNVAFNVGVLAGKERFAGILSADSAMADTEGGGLMVEKIARAAARFDPLESGYRYAQADAGLATGDASRTLDRFAEALRLNPLNAEYSQRLGLVLGNLGQDERAEQLLRSGVRNDNSNPERHKALAFWLLSEGRVEEGLEQVRQAIAWGPQKTREYLTLMSLFGLNDEEMRRNLPEQSTPLLAYGDYLAGIGKEKEAQQSYRSAVRIATEEERPNPATFLRAAEFFTVRKLYNEALEGIQTGIEIFPDNADFRYVAASLYEQLGITYRAIEEYRASLALDPNNENARENLRKIVGEAE